MMPVPYMMFFVGVPILVVLMMAFTFGMAVERRRIRRYFHSDEDLMSAERAGYQSGMKHGYTRARHEQRQHEGCGHASVH